MADIQQNTSDITEINTSVAPKAAWVKPALIRIGDEGIEGKILFATVEISLSYNQS